MKIEPVRIAVVVAVLLLAGWVSLARPFGPIGTATALAFLVLISLFVVALPSPSGPDVAPAGIPMAQRWEKACTMHDDVLKSYGAYELDPELLLKYPDLWDLKAQPVMNFHDALELADTLRTDDYPGDSKATEYIGAVTMLNTDWKAAEAYAKAADEQLRHDREA